MEAEVITIALPPASVRCAPVVTRAHTLSLSLSQPHVSFATDIRDALDFRPLRVELNRPEVGNKEGPEKRATSRSAANFDRHYFCPRDDWLPAKSLAAGETRSRKRECARPFFSPRNNAKLLARVTHSTLGFDFGLPMRAAHAHASPSLSLRLSQVKSRPACSSSRRGCFATTTA